MLSKTIKTFALGDLNVSLEFNRLGQLARVSAPGLDLPALALLRIADLAARECTEIPYVCAEHGQYLYEMQKAYGCPWCHEERSREEKQRQQAQGKPRHKRLPLVE